MIAAKPTPLNNKRLKCKISPCGGRCLRPKETCRLGTSATQKKIWTNALNQLGRSHPGISKAVATVAVGAIATIVLAQGTKELVNYKINNDKDFESFVSASISVGQENMQLLAKKAGIEDIGQTISDSLYELENSKATKKDLSRREKIKVERIAKTTLGAQQEIAQGKRFENEIPSDWKNFRASDLDRMEFLNQTLHDDTRKAQTQADLDKYHKIQESLKGEALSPEELSALRHYTDPVGYREINATLRGDEASRKFTMDFLRKRGDRRTEKEIQERAILEARLATSALNKMPDYKGKVYRGGNYPQEYIDSLEPGKTIQDKAFTSSTNNVVKKFPGNTQFIINSSSGKYISKYMNESQDEVLFRPETSFIVTDKKQVKVGGKLVTVAYMNEKVIKTNHN